MLRIAGEEVVTEELYRKARVSKSPYQGGTFEGNECRRIVRAAASSDWHGQHPLAPYRSLFRSLDQIYNNVFADRFSLNDFEIAKINEEVGQFVQVWQQSAPLLELTSPLKLHVLAVHVPEFAARHRATPAAFGEQDGESAHRLFTQLQDTFRAMGPKTLQHTVKVFNACHF